MKSIVAIVLMAVLMSGCTITNRPSIDTMTLLNERLTNIEKSIENRPRSLPAEAEGRTFRRPKLNTSQREFIEVMMDYLGEQR